ncbi:MAG TPA: T9SS type A sorting domain-containing protein, partial [Chitinophagaceae bacterium]|nr:T9SS type A sorting domain-containing protein [Chitinophagaceae bacterium]
PLTRSITSASDTGYYRVVVTNAAGCTYATNRARVDFYPPTPKPSLVYTPPLLSITGGTYRAFQWYQDIKWIFGATGKTYTVSSKGKFYVEVTDANGCTINSDTLDIQPPTGINPQYADMKVRLYPNPTHTSVTIDAPIKVNVMVTDIAGKTLLSIKDATTVDLADFADGSYFFRITDENGQTLGTEKINKISAP